MKCNLCGNEMEKCIIPYKIREGLNIKVDGYICKNCNEIYISPDSCKKIEINKILCGKYR